MKLVLLLSMVLASFSVNAEDSVSSTSTATASNQASSSAGCPAVKPQTRTGRFCASYVTARTGDYMEDACYGYIGLPADSEQYTQVNDLLFTDKAARLILDSDTATRNELLEKATSVGQLIICISGTIRKTSDGTYTFTRIRDVLTSGEADPPFQSVR